MIVKEWVDIVHSNFKNYKGSYVSTKQVPCKKGLMALSSLVFSSESEMTHYFAYCEPWYWRKLV